MGWLLGRKREFRFLDTKTPSGGLVFWVDDMAKVLGERGDVNGGFVNRMMMEVGERLPFYWLVAMATSEPRKTSLKIKAFRYPEGGCEVHIDHPAITKDESGKITVGG